MKKLFLAVMLVSMTLIFFGSTVCVKAQTSKATTTTVVTKDNSSPAKSCCKSGITATCDKSKCDKSKCTGKCIHSGTSCVNSPGCKKVCASNTASVQRKSCCEAMKTKSAK